MRVRGMDRLATRVGKVNPSGGVVPRSLRRSPPLAEAPAAGDDGAASTCGAMLLRQTGQHGACGSSVIAQPAWRQWRQASRRHMSPAIMGSRQTQQTSCFEASESVSRNITVTSSTASSASRRREMHSCTPFTNSLSRRPSCSSSSSFTRGFVSWRRAPSAAQTSTRAVVAWRRCQMSAKRDGWTPGKGWRVWSRSRQLLSMMDFPRGAWTPRTSETQHIFRRIRGEKAQEGQCCSGNSRVPSTSAKGVVMVTGNST
mmetsp:Transcript_75818/g.214366  ORF Transcript_75818/g.214366 Transcript_75818/m.214366 type:complete len:257 (+) Transcript_75818:205-975(+)